MQLNFVVDSNKVFDLNINILSNFISMFQLAYSLKFIGKPLKIWMYPYILLATIILLSSCANEKKEPVPGTRISIISNAIDELIVNTDLSSKNLSIGPQYPRPCFNRSTYSGFGNILMDFERFSGRIDTKFSIKGNSKPPVTLPLILRDRMVILEQNGRLSAIDLIKTTTLWENTFFKSFNVKHKNIQISGGGLLSWEDKIFVTAGINEVAAFNTNTGKLLWSRKLSSPIKSVPLIVNNKLILQGNDGIAFILNATHGDVLASFPGPRGLKIEKSIVSAAPVELENGLVGIQDTKGMLSIIDIEKMIKIPPFEKKTLSTNFIQATLDIVSCQPVFDTKQNRLFSLNSLEGITALSLTQQNFIWQKKFNVTAPFWGSGDFVYALNEGRKLIAIYSHTGGIKWIADLKNVTRNPDREYTSPIVAGNNIVTLGSGGTLLCFDALTGKLNYQFNLKIKTNIQPIFIGKYVYIVGNNGSIMRIT